MSKELLEVHTCQYVESAAFQPYDDEKIKYFIVQADTTERQAPCVNVYDEDENFVETFTSWSHLQAVFRDRGWKIADNTLWSNDDSWLGWIRQVNELEAAGFVEDDAEFLYQLASEAS